MVNAFIGRTMQGDGEHPEIVGAGGSRNRISVSIKPVAAHRIDMWHRDSG
ncbi:hypothetical protein [Burkholderia ubonensis]